MALYSINTKLHIFIMSKLFIILLTLHGYICFKACVLRNVFMVSLVAEYPTSCRIYESAVRWSCLNCIFFLITAEKENALTFYHKSRNFSGFI